jgi:membrane-associated protease RseP (regulator of RpoE activity)
VTISDLSDNEEFRLKNFRFANVLYPDIVMQTSKQNALGLAFFRRHNVVFDFPFNMLYLEHHQDYATFQELDKSGIQVVLKDNKLIVFSMKHLKKAVVKGIKTGDEIVSVNGKKLSLFQIRQLLREKTGTRIFLEIRRKDGVHKGSVVLGKDPLS